MTIDTFLPSEVARLVLGYLAETGCQRSHETFLSECNDLREYASLLAGGLHFSTNVGGKSLLDVLAEYCYLSRQANSHPSEKLPVLPGVNSTAVPPISTPSNAGDVYRTARHLLSTTGRSSCPPPLPNTPSVVSTPVMEPKTCQVSIATGPSPSPGPSQQQQPEQQPSDQMQGVTSTSDVVLTQPVSQSPVRTPVGTGAPPTTIDLEESAPNSNATTFSQQDPLAGIDSMDPLFDFAKTLADNINSVIAKEDAKNEKNNSFLSPEKAGQIIEMTEHDPNFDRFVRTLFTSGDTSFSFEGVANEEPTEAVNASKSADSLNAPSTSGTSAIASSSQVGTSNKRRKNRKAGPPTVAQLLAGQVAEQPPTEHLPKKRTGPGRPRGRRDHQKRLRSCKVKDPFAPEPLPPSGPINPKVHQFLTSFNPLPKVGIPRLPRTSAQGPPAPVAIPSSVGQVPLSVLFANNSLPAPGPNSCYLMDAGGGNLFMVSMPGTGALPKLTLPQAPDGMPKRIIISPAEENCGNTPPPSTPAALGPSPLPPNTTVIDLANDVSQACTAPEVGVADPSPNIVVAAEHPPSAAVPVPEQRDNQQPQQMHSHSILDSIGFDELFYRSPNRLLSASVFSLGSESKLRTPPDDSQPSFLGSFMNPQSNSTAIRQPQSSVVQHLMFDDPVHVQLPHLSTLVSSHSSNNNNNIGGPVSNVATTSAIYSTNDTSSFSNSNSWSVTQQREHPIVAFQSTTDSQQQSGRVLRRIPPIPVPNNSNTQTSTFPPPSNMRRTRSSVNRDNYVTASSSSTSKPSSSKRRRENTDAD